MTEQQQQAEAGEGEEERKWRRSRSPCVEAAMRKRRSKTVNTQGKNEATAAHRAILHPSVMFCVRVRGCMRASVCVCVVVGRSLRR